MQVLKFFFYQVVTKARQKHVLMKWEIIIIKKKYEFYRQNSSVQIASSIILLWFARTYTWTVFLAFINEAFESIFSWENFKNFYLNVHRNDNEIKASK